ncbi:protein of unknown function (plasmid) [Caballeronia sp. S22]
MLISVAIFTPVLSGCQAEWQVNGARYMVHVTCSNAHAPKVHASESMMAQPCIVKTR